MLKDWKKTGDNKWKKGNYLIVVLNSGSADGNIISYAFWLVKINSQKIVIEKNFKTKSQAIKFAKDYMKKHPKG